jgi:uncharacterized repeat protein (TIGR01451 family)
MSDAPEPRLQERPGQRKDSRAFGALCDELLARGHRIRFTASGRSMTPNIYDGDRVIVGPPVAAGARRGQIAFTRSAEGFRAHRIVRESDEKPGHVVTRGDAGVANDPTPSAVIGKVISIERGRREISAWGSGACASHAVRRHAHRVWRATRQRLTAPLISIILFAGLFLLSASPAFAAAGLTINITSPANGTLEAVGSSVTFAVTLTNTGTTPISTVQVTFPDPVNMTYVSGAKTGGSSAFICNHSNVTLQITCPINGGNYSSGSSTQFAFVYTVKANPTGTTITASARATGNGVTVTPSTITLNIATTLSVADTGAPKPVAPGDALVYTVALSNSSGVNSVANETVTMVDPTNLTFVSFGTTTGTGTWTCNNTAGTITCTDTANYNTGSATTFTFNFKVNAGTPNGTVISSTANAQSANTLSAGTDGDSTTVTVPTLTISNTEAPNPVAPGDTTTYTVVLSNSSGVNALANETVSMADPANETFVSAAATSGTGTWTCANTSGTATCTDTATYASGASTTFKFIFTVNSGTANGTLLSSTASAQASNTTSVATANATATVKVPTLLITNSGTPNPIAPTDTLTYSVTLTNSSGVNALPNLTVSMPDPTNLTFVSAAASFGTGSWTCNNASGTLTCTDTATYPTGSSTTFAFVFTVNSTTANGTVITSTASGQASNTTSAVTANANVTVQTPDISVTNTANPTTQVTTGSTITYTQVVTNNGGEEAVGVSFTESVPTNTTFSSVTAPSANWTCTTPAGGNTGTITCTENAGTAVAASGGTATLTVVVTVNSGTGDLGSNISDTVTVSEPGNETNLANNSATAIVGVTSADLSMTQSVSPAVIVAGGTLTYTETVTNSGPNAATSVTLYQQTPPNTTFSSITFPAGWACTSPAAGATGQVICTIASLASGSTSTNFTYQVKVNNGATTTPAPGTTIQNYADVTSVTSDPLPSNNATQTSTLVEVSGDADLGVTGGASPTPVFVDSTLIYTVQVTNYGLAASSGTSLKDTLPAGVTYSSSSSTQGTCTQASGVVTCTLGAVAVSTSTPITVTITVTTPSAATTLTNTATVSSTGSTDPVSSNNTVNTITVVQPLVCATPGKDGSPTSALTGTVNTYYAAASSVTTVSPGAISIALGASTGSSTTINAGDLVLIIQMQDASINTTSTTINTGAYGDGVPGDPGSGSTNLNSSGLYEFVTATSSVGSAGGTLTFIGTGPALSANGNVPGLLNTYVNAAASASQGQAKFQVIRVPQYQSATLSSTLTALPWNGSVGGILALDVASQLTLGGTVSLDGMGFRGAGGRILSGGSGAGTDYVTLSTNNANGSKGEGIAGTPAYVAPLTQNITTSTTATATGQTYVEGIPSGSYARGAPGNAGGGATDANPPSNNQNSGGGGGGNGGTGGVGGFGWQSAGIVGGFGGVAFPGSTSALVMGGGGGAGTSNDGAWWDPIANTGSADCGTTCTGIYSSGTAGGGIVIIRAGSITGTGTITANGQNALEVENDGGGGGGAGGSFLIFSNSGGLGGLTLQANGGLGGITWPEDAPTTPFPGNRHGPGGGGGGGFALLTGAPAGLSLLGGNPGYSTLANDAYGATPGQMGTSNTGLTVTQTPGTQSGAYCAGADLSVTNTVAPTIVLPGGTLTYTQTVSNNGPFDALNATLNAAVPQNTTLAAAPVISGAGAAGWVCTTTNGVSCSNPDVPSGTSGVTTFTYSVVVAPATPSGTQIIDTALVTSGTNDPSLTNNSATAVALVAAANTANLVITQSATPNPVADGGTISYTVTVTNNGPATATGVNYSEVIPSSAPVYATFGSTAMGCASGWTCTHPATGATGTINGSIASLASGGTATFTYTLNVSNTAPSGTIISETANVSSNITDPDPNTNSATSNVVVAAAGQFDLYVTSTASPNPVLPGNNITYNVTAGNNGPGSASNVVLSGSVPTGTTFVSLAIPAGAICTSLPAVGGTGAISCCPGTGTTCSGAAFPTGAPISFPMVVKVNSSDAPGTIITNTLNLGPTSGDVTPANNASTTTTVVASPTQADVSIVKTASPNPVDQGTNLTYLLQVTNAGPAIAQNVSVTDPLPTQVTYNSVSTTQGTCTGGSLVLCSLGSLSVGSEVTITINASADTFSATTYAVNTATVSSSTSDPNSANNSSTVTSTIETPTAVLLSSLQAQLEPQGGVLIQWHTKEEIRNLGFHVYRDDSTGHHQVDPSLIAGAALILRGGMPQHAAKTYRWIDPNGTAQSTYWVEDVDLNGTRTMHGPVQPESALPTADAVGTRSMLLSEINSAAKSAAATVAAPNSFGSVQPHPVVFPQPVAALNAASISNATLNGQEGIEISVSQTGWYQVSAAKLFAAGLSPHSDPRSLQLYAEGVEQPLLVSAQSNGILGQNGSIEFYGTGIDTPFSGTRVYWLINGSSAGLRIGEVHAQTSQPPSVNDFSATTVLEQRTTYFTALLNGENNDNFFGAVITSSPVDQQLTATHTDPTSSIPVSIDVQLQGGTDQQAHAVSISFNGTYVGEMDFANQVNVTNSFTVSNSLLQEGTNTVTLAALNGDNDISVVQAITLHYPHTYTADSNWLPATAASGTSIHIGGFTNPQVQVFDITDPLSITEMVGRITLDGAAYGISLNVSGSGAGQRTLLAFSSDQIAAPDALTAHTPNHLDQPLTGASYVVISHPDFASSIAPLVSLHESEGQGAMVVTTDELYDAYNFGEKSPYALRSFLQYASTNWRQKPQDVLLMGDASFDPRNYLGLGDLDFVPSRMVETQAFKTASDDWLTDFNQTGYATIPTGRIPADTPDDAALAVSKLVNFENGSTAGSWQQQATFVADANVGADFSDAAKAASLLSPPSLTATTILTDGEDPSTAQQQVVNAINNGSLLVDYSGHGAEDQWSFSDFFDATTIPTLINGDRQPVFLLMDCLNGFFEDVYENSLAEDLLFAPNGGAVAVWASSGFTVEPPQATMNQALLSALSANPSISLGAAILQAKTGITDPDVRRTWTLFGDPAMKLPLASAPAQSNTRTSGPAAPRPAPAHIINTSVAAGNAAR